MSCNLPTRPQSAARRARFNPYRAFSELQRLTHGGGATPERGFNPYRVFQ